MSASLDGAQLQGGSLVLAQLQGASLNYAQLQGANLREARLQGASLNGAQLQAASLLGAQLQGANFRGSTLAGTDMSGAAVWRTNFEHASLAADLEDGVHDSPIPKDWFPTLKSTVMKEVSEGANSKYVLERIDILNPDIFGPEASEQETLEKGRVDETGYKKSLTDQLKSLACSGDADAAYIVRGLITSVLFDPSRISRAGAQAPGLVEAILKPDCPVSAALTEADKAALKEIGKEASAAH